MALDECTWMVSVGAILFFLNSCVLGTRCVTSSQKSRRTKFHLHVPYRSKQSCLGLGASSRSQSDQVDHSVDESSFRDISCRHSHRTYNIIKVICDAAGSR